ncbi:hypothetical protein Flavo103_31980 [Flavobacterium collinsii]|jgi:hypothetical protein|uniref:hypothetical protein n=1 Tax=Flavobacterium collinsii TaxID=1114861 RepID=UPI0022C37604|nr:hypothetical protein [Flavobacterium collinsii]GIQ60062.1 hypothetical protein Flavo103_31980 [Flavobacterium collinsii]
MIIRRLIRIMGGICILFALVGFFPAMGDIFMTLYYRDVITNYAKYGKKYIEIDSLTYMNTDGNDNPRVDGYSKQLNNYKTIILFDKSSNDSDYFGNENGPLKGFVWYRKGIDFAFPAKKEDTIFPVKEYIYKNLKIPLLWLFSIIIAFISYKISKKSKLFKKVNEDEQNN